jgi:nucleotide-binding universal stress UspA family protein
MTIATVFLHVASETLDTRCGATRYALDLAHASKAHLEALVLELDVTTPKSDYVGRVRYRNTDVGIAGDALGTEASKKGVEATVVTERSHMHSAPEIAADHARLADVIVAGVCNEGLLSERLVAEALIFQSGRPVIIVPADHKPIFCTERVVVAWDYSKVAARALSDALPFLRTAAEVTLVCFGDDKDFSSSLSQDDVLAALRHRGVEALFIQNDRGGRSIGEAINAAAAEYQADLLVMGGFGHNRIRDFILGGATKTMLSSPTLPTLISH